MKSIFQPADRDAILARIYNLRPECTRQWGTMDPAQMLCHCALALETGTGDRPMKQKFIGKILMPFIRSSILGEKPFSKNSPTDPTFVVSGARDFEAERKRLIDLIQRFVERGEEAAGRETHAFFGRMTGKEWGELTYKHLDHHLQQFGV
ncbi:MAG: DUF1569 domain-containing protein [Thermoanaerobaculia bacterium]